MFFTVAICTWNRADLLAPTLERMTELEVPSGVEWELIVVNNGCTDATDDVIARFADRLPLRRVFESTLGLSSARNAAVRAARAPNLIWTDDDVLVDRGWLAAYARAFGANPDCTVFGGPVRPWFDGTPPDWLRVALERTSQVRYAFALREFGDEPFRYDWNEVERFPFGANMAMRTECLRRHPFDPALGRKGSSMLSGEETEVIRGILREGGHGLWVPDAAVRHFVPRARQTRAYIRRYFEGIGEGTVRDRPEIFATPRRLWNVPLWLWRRAVETEIGHVSHALAGDHPRSVQSLINASYCRGQLRVLLRDRNSPAWSTRADRLGGSEQAEKA